MFSSDHVMIIFEAKIWEEHDRTSIYNIFIVTISGKNLTRITGDNGESDILPQFSPDGMKISYVTYVFEDCGKTHHIRITNRDGNEEEVLSIYPWESGPSWFS
jgi:Tol biopolymer transport system component